VFPIVSGRMPLKSRGVDLVPINGDQAPSGKSVTTKVDCSASGIFASRTHTPPLVAATPGSAPVTRHAPRPASARQHPLLVIVTSQRDNKRALPLATVQSKRDSLLSFFLLSLILVLPYLPCSFIIISLNSNSHIFCGLLKYSTSPKPPTRAVSLNSEHQHHLAQHRPFG
jgi:hypothetical protein